jgi:hypothetical protein
MHDHDEIERARCRGDPDRRIQRAVARLSEQRHPERRAVPPGGRLGVADRLGRGKPTRPDLGVIARVRPRIATRDDARMRDDHREHERERDERSAPRFASERSRRRDHAPSVDLTRAHRESKTSQ